MPNGLYSLEPHWVTGFSDGESCFSVDISKDKVHKLGWKVTPVFSIGLHSKELDLIKNMQSFFSGAGKIYLIGDSKVFYRIKSVKDLEQYVIPHFDKYPLLTQKRADFLLLKKIVELMLHKEHLTTEGLLKFLSLKASLNQGLPDGLKTAFPNIVPQERPVVECEGLHNPNWLAGFACAESCFFCAKTCIQNT